jgi:hypothetical protein
LRAVLLNRGKRSHPRQAELAAIGVPTIRTLNDLSASLAWIESYAVPGTP